MVDSLRADRLLSQAVAFRNLNSGGNAYFWADASEYTAPTVWSAGEANVAAVFDQTVAPADPSIFGKKQDEILFDPNGVAVTGKTKPARNSSHMSIHHDSNGRVKDCAKNDVCRFTPDSWKRYEFVHRLGNASVMVFDQVLRAELDVSSFGSKKSGAFDHTGNFLKRCFCHDFRGSPFLKQDRSNSVDPFICALC